MGIFVNKCGPLLFISVHLTTGVYGLLYAMPTLYQSSTVLFVMQVITCFSLAEVIISWYVTRRTDSSYHPNGSLCLQKQSMESGLSDGDSDLYEVTSERYDVKEIVTSLSSTILCESRPSHKYQNANDFMIRVTTHSLNGMKEKRPFPYWSWIPCAVCQIYRPPRCHHCDICKKCILKRDHHCYFTGSCVGVKNQGHFIVFMFWAVFVTLFGTVHMLPYTYLEILPLVSYVDFFPPVSVARVILGYTPLFAPFLCTLFWVVLILSVFSIVIFYEILKVTLHGTTAFENANRIKVTDCRSLSTRWYEVLGRKWLVSFLVPSRISTKDKEDAIHWPHIKL